ncbi:vreteno [Haematobia irritans]|uniref:vreteno n=1 Tax=Haematobia irritans TaxID=7368 RepID=UPI003F4FB351
MDDEAGFCEDFDKWNPMESDYKSVEFNRYNTGPGANLDLSLQQPKPKGDANKLENVPTPFLLFKNMPHRMTKSALHNICSKHGKVTSIRDSQKCDYFFADFATVADMEAAFRALEKNNYGFQVFVGRHNRKISPTDFLNSNRLPTVPPRSIGIDYENRRYQVSNKLPPRPTIYKKPLVEKEQIYGIPSEALNNDAHLLEREGCYRPVQRNKYKYHTGRSYIEIPDDTRKFVVKKHNESIGQYCESAEQYTNKSCGIDKPDNIGKCTTCSRSCDSICSRCSTYYCSLDCQKSNWQQHRYICGKTGHLQKTLPKMGITPKLKLEEKENYSESKTQQLVTTAKNYENCSPKIPRSGNVVTITAISKTNIVFLRGKSYHDDINYFKTIDGIQSISKLLKPLTILPKCGNVVIGKYRNQYNRALVLNADNKENIFLNFMDYGNLDSLRLEDLYEAPLEYTERPRHAVPVILKDVPDSYMTEEIRNFMYSYLDGINVYIKYKPEDYDHSKNVYKVELIDETTQQNLNKMITKMSIPTEPKRNAEICYREYLQITPLPNGDNTELIVMDNSLMSTGCISCTTKPFAYEIQKFQHELQRYVVNLPKIGYAPRVDELCIVKYKEDGLWYRGRCLEIVGDGYPTVLFLDYGNIAIVHLDDIRRYPSQFTFPIYTADCEISGLPETCSEDIVRVLEELIPNGSTIKCQYIKAYENDHFYSISLPHIIKELSDYGLL